MTHKARRRWVVISEPASADQTAKAFGISAKRDAYVDRIVDEILADIHRDRIRGRTRIAAYLDDATDFRPNGRRASRGT